MKNYETLTCCQKHIIAMLEVLITVIRIEVQALQCSYIHILYETLFHIHSVIDVFSHYFCFFVDYSEVLLIFKAFLT